MVSIMIRILRPGMIAVSVHDVAGRIVSRNAGEPVGAGDQGIAWGVDGFGAGLQAARAGNAVRWGDRPSDRPPETGSVPKLGFLRSTRLSKASTTRDTCHIPSRNKPEPRVGGRVAAGEYSSRLLGIVRIPNGPRDVVAVRKVRG